MGRGASYILPGQHEKSLCSFFKWTAQINTTNKQLHSGTRTAQANNPWRPNDQHPEPNTFYTQHHTDWGNTEAHNKWPWIHFTSLFLLRGQAAPNVRCGDAGVCRMVWCPGGHIRCAGRWALRPSIGGVQELCLSGSITGSTQRQLLLLQELDLLFELVLPLLLLMYALWERTSVCEWSVCSHVTKGAL